MYVHYLPLRIAALSQLPAGCQLDILYINIHSVHSESTDLYAPYHGQASSSKQLHLYIKMMSINQTKYRLQSIKSFYNSVERAFKNDLICNCKIIQCLSLAFYCIFIRLFSFICISLQKWVFLQTKIMNRNKNNN